MDERRALAVLVLLTLVLAVVPLWLGPAVLPPAAVVVSVMGGAMLLDVRRMRWLLAVVAVVAAVHVSVLSLDVVRPGALAVLAAVSGVAYEISRGRDRVGVSGPQGSAMLTELRERLRRQGALPGLPPGWHAEIVLRPAGGGGSRATSRCRRGRPATGSSR